MANTVYFVDALETISNSDFSNLRKLYLPIIGVSSVVLYEYLYDLSFDKLKNKHKLEDLSLYLQVSDVTISESIEKLEAVGLINTYRNSNDDSIYMFEILKPCNIDMFSKNPLLKSHLIKLIGQKEWERISFDQKTKFNNKKDFVNVSKKYQDVFENNFNENIIVPSDGYTTLELNVECFETHDENIFKLPSTHFIKYLLKRNASYYENQMINYLLRIGFNDNSINLLIDFSMKVNNAIICQYIITIANDFRDRSIISFDEVKHEISIIESIKSRKNKKAIKKQKSFDTFNEESEYNESENVAISDIFNEEEIKGIF